MYVRTVPPEGIMKNTNFWLMIVMWIGVTVIATVAVANSHVFVPIIVVFFSMMMQAEYLKK